MILAFAGTLWNVNLAAKIACSVLSGLLLLRFFVIYHDQQHHAILPRSRIAEALMRVFGIFALSASSVWRSSHNHHHSHNSKLRGSQIGSFPIMTRNQFEKCAPSDRRRYLSMRHPLTILFGYFSMFLYGMCINPFLNDSKKHYDCLIALVVHVAIGAALLTWWGWQQLLLTQTLPHFITYAIGSYLFYAQHNFPGVSFNDKSGWTYEKAALEYVEFCEDQSGDGLVHREYRVSPCPSSERKDSLLPAPEAIRDMPELQIPRTTTLRPMDIYRCLRLKVWDVKLQRMISLRELASNVSRSAEGAPA